jgi:hypothetical protein
MLEVILKRFESVQYVLVRDFRINLFHFFPD